MLVFGMDYLDCAVYKEPHGYGRVQQYVLNKDKIMCYMKFEDGTVMNCFSDEVDLYILLQVCIDKFAIS